jgi:hypothetical protein
VNAFAVARSGGRARRRVGGSETHDDGRRMVRTLIER